MPRLARAERGAAALHTALQLVTRVAHLRVLELPAPMRDAKVLRTLILLDLESHPPDAGIDRVTVTIAPTPGRVIQHSLLTRARPSPEQIATLTARLTAVFGEGRVGSPALVDTYEPGAFALCGFDGDASPPPPPGTLAADAGPTVDGPGPRAKYAAFVIRRFRQPVAVRVERRRGRPLRVTVPSGELAGGGIVQAAGPWRTSGAWWTAADVPASTPVEAKEEGSSHPTGRGAAAPAVPGTTPWDHDEWDVVVGDGSVLRLSRNRLTDSWFIEGILD